MAFEWLNISSSNIHSYCGHSYGYELGPALNGNNIWMHNLNHTHWFVLDLGGRYNITRVRGRSDDLWDPTNVAIYVFESIAASSGDAVTPSIVTWQNTDTWQIIETTPKEGRFLRVVILDTEDSEQILGFGSSADWGAPPFEIFNVYGERVPTNIYFIGYCISEINAWGTLVGTVGLPFEHTVHVSTVTKEAVLGGYVPLAGSIFGESTLEGNLEAGTIPEHFTVTFAGVELCPGHAWPTGEDFNDQDIVLTKVGGWDIYTWESTGPPWPIATIDLEFHGEGVDDVLRFYTGIFGETDQWFIFSGDIPHYRASLRDNQLTECTGFTGSKNGTVLIAPGVAISYLTGTIAGQSTVSGLLGGITKQISGSTKSIFEASSTLLGVVKDISGSAASIFESSSTITGIAVHLEGIATEVVAVDASLSGIKVDIIGKVSGRSGVGV